MPDEIVTLWVYRDLPEALVVRSKLEAEGIGCFLTDENIVRMDWFWSNAMGGVKLQVQAEDTEAAMELLKAGIPVSISAEELGGEEYRQPECPQCHSLDVGIQEYSEFSLPFSYLLNVPTPILKGCWKCEDCSFEWQDERELKTQDPSL